MKNKSKSKNKNRRAPQERRDAGVRRDAEGRLHLALHRDPVTGTEQLFLKKPVFKEAWQNDVAVSGASTVRGILGSEPSLERAIELTRRMMDATSRLADGFLSHAPAGSVACKAGCDHCCHQSVGVTPPEALTIVDHVKSTRTGAALAEFTAHVAARYQQTRGLSSRERFSREHPCIFLEEGRCSIYEVRPLSCRGMNSLDADECRVRLVDPEARAAFLATGSGSRSFLEPIRAFHAISAGLQLGLAEFYDVDVRPLDLTAAVHFLLTAPETIGRAWVAGEATFESMRGSDSTNDSVIRELSGVLPDSK